MLLQLAVVCLTISVHSRPHAGYGDLGFTGAVPSCICQANTGYRAPNRAHPQYRSSRFQWEEAINMVCSGSRAALMTGRHFTRTGVPGVLFPTQKVGLPLNETTVAAQLAKAGYTSAAIGKWHLGQREMYLPANRGFDYYLGIPYSADMGAARATPCNNNSAAREIRAGKYTEAPIHTGPKLHARKPSTPDPAERFLPLVYQQKIQGKTHANTTVLEQPLDFSTLGPKYNQFMLNFVSKHAAGPFFLYVPFSHVHATSGTQPQEQYASCAFQNVTSRGLFGDALAEVDWMVGNLVAKLEELGIHQNTLIFFTGDNGPDMFKGQSGGSEGLFTGRFSDYWNTGKGTSESPRCEPQPLIVFAGSTWEGGIREAAFAYWPTMIEPNTRSAEVVSSLDLFPTVSALVNVPLPNDRVYDGRDMSDILFQSDGKSKHQILFIYASGPYPADGGPAAARMGRWKAHWATGPGLGGCSQNCSLISYPVGSPLLFDVVADPSEAYPLAGVPAAAIAPEAGSSRLPGQGRACGPGYATAAEIAGAVELLIAARKKEIATFERGTLIPAPDLPGEGIGRYGVCCDRDPYDPDSIKKNATCDCD